MLMVAMVIKSLPCIQKTMSMFNVQYHVRTADVVNSCFKEPHAIPDDDFRDYFNNDMMTMSMMTMLMMTMMTMTTMTMTMMTMSMMTMIMMTMTTMTMTMMTMNMFHFVTEFRAESISSARATSFPSSENILADC